ncbi:Iron-sulfur cluster-binding protein [Thermogutta terrifontis]|uniref:Iron-sulfur cluster-binding protein n=1 Tax=Thermogutta terrifontis TaxID=1331910 RepID=A0A286RAP4_9BACT|nr:DUF362 domain-containing protein [Thermogutta terrifontis]ASV73035.1 Iron-sulfur cluster-binding protein [Thermogutta terrifontis]
MHAKSTRREFLWQSAVATGGLLLPAQLSWAAPSETKMVITKWTGPSPQSPTEFAKIATQLTEQAVAALGGMSRFVKRGDVVWIKPNIGWDRTPELGANTNPDVVATLVRLCLDAGAKVVKVGDNPCDLPQKAYASSGIADAARKAGAQVVFLDRDRFREMDIKGERVKTIPVYPEIVESDVVINVPIAKHHVLATATLCMKNYMGVIENRRVFHQDIPTCLADITRFMRPSLCLLDCTRVMLAHGPKGGNIEDVAVRLTLAAGTDIVALDAFGAEMLGRKPSDIGSIVKGHQVGLGTMDYRSLQPKEITLS